VVSFVQVDVSSGTTETVAELPGVRRPRARDLRRRAPPRRALPRNRRTRQQRRRLLRAGLTPAIATARHFHGHGWARTSDLSRVKRGFDRTQNCTIARSFMLPRGSLVGRGRRAICRDLSARWATEMLRGPDSRQRHRLRRERKGCALVSVSNQVPGTAVQGSRRLTGAGPDGCPSRGG
jgi:hypothetical protein